MLEVRDNGKPLPEAQWDIADAIGCFRYYAELARELDGRQDEALELPDARFRCRIRHEPVGVAGQIIPWNYPLLMAAWKVAPALAAGATCVLAVGADPAHRPGTGQRGRPHRPALRRAQRGHRPRRRCRRAAQPAPGRGQAGLHRQRADGAKIMSAAAADIKNISLELGGKSAFIVFDDADVEAAVEWIMFGIFWNQGQVCSATSRLLVQEGIAPRLLERLVAEARRITIGPGWNAACCWARWSAPGSTRRCWG